MTATSYFLEPSHASFPFPFVWRADVCLPFVDEKNMSLSLDRTGKGGEWKGLACSVLLLPFLYEDIEGLGDGVAKQETQPGHHRRVLPLLPDRWELLCALWPPAK